MKLLADFLLFVVIPICSYCGISLLLIEVILPSLDVVRRLDYQDFYPWQKPLLAKLLLTMPILAVIALLSHRKSIYKPFTDGLRQ